MQAGYRRDPTESAKALKSKLKGKKRDSILYGAVIKQQSALSTIGNAPIPPSNPNTPGAPFPPPPMGPAVVFSNVSQLSGGPLEGSRTSAAPASTPARINTQRPMGAIDAKVLQDQLAKLKKNQDMISRAPILTKQQEIEAMAKTQKANLKPHDSRKPTVGITTPLAPSKLGAIRTYDAEPRSGLKTTLVGQSYQKKPFDNISPTASLSDISEAAPTFSSETSAPTLAPAPANSPIVQDLAKRLFTDFSASLMTPRKSITITAYGANGSLPFKIQLYAPKGANHRYTITSKTNAANMDSVNIPDSINAAISKVSNGTLATNLKPGAVNGLGFNESDPTKISSSRIAWMNDRDSGRKLPKGMIYVMGPSLLRGDLRVYNKSGKAVMSASKISPAFQRIVRDTIDRNTFDPQDYSTIEPSESADVNHFISISKPIAPSGIDRLANADGIWKLKKRYEVLVGELSAGNDGSLVRQEMEAILRSLMRMHAINPAKAKDLIKALHDY